MHHFTRFTEHIRPISCCPVEDLYQVDDVTMYVRASNKIPNMKTRVSGISTRGARKVVVEKA